MSQIQYEFISQGETKYKSVPFQSLYLCNGIFEEQINFEYINKNN